MEQNKIVEMTSGGIVCDNPECDYIDETVTIEMYHDFLNKSCPKCGENLLTEEDFELAMRLQHLGNFFNSLSPEQVEEWNKSQGYEVKPEMKDKKLHVTFHAHKEISVKEVKIVD